MLTLHNRLRKVSNIGKVYFSPTLVNHEDPETGEITEEFWRKEIPPQNHGSHYLTQELVILLSKQSVSGKNLWIILQMRVVFPGNGNAPKLIFKE